MLKAECPSCFAVVPGWQMTGEYDGAGPPYLRPCTNPEYEKGKIALLETMAKPSKRKIVILVRNEGEINEWNSGL